jgi:hypothetical protein
MLEIATKIKLSNVSLSRKAQLWYFMTNIRREVGCELISKTSNS